MKFNARSFITQDSNARIDTTRNNALKMRIDVLKFVIATVITIAACILMLTAQGSAQGLGSLSQLFGGHSNSQSSGHSGGSIVVQRQTPPFIGTFHGQQKVAPDEMIQTKFACYPAHDAALPNNQAFICYMPAAPSASTE